MKKFLIIPTLLFSYFSLFGQVLQTVQSVDTHSYYEILSPKSGKTLSYSDISGSPYYKKEFTPAKVADNYETLVARYNSYSDEIEFQKDEKLHVLPKQDVFSKIIFTNTKEKLALVNTGDDLSGYFFELSSGKYPLYKKVKTRFIDMVKSSNGYAEDKPAKFQTLEPKYYIKTEKGFIKDPKNVKEIVDQIPEKKESIETFVKSNKIKFNKEEDLIKLVNFLNQN